MYWSHLYLFPGLKNVSFLCSVNNPRDWDILLWETLTPSALSCNFIFQLSHWSAVRCHIGFGCGQSRLYKVIHHHWVHVDWHNAMSGDGRSLSNGHYDMTIPGEASSLLGYIAIVTIVSQNKLIPQDWPQVKNSIMGGTVYFAEIVWKWNFSAAVLLIYLLFWKHIFREAGVRHQMD